MNMKFNKHIWKSILAVTLSLSLLAGVSTMIDMPISAAEETASAAENVGVFSVEAEDYKNIEDLSDKLAFYYTQENMSFQRTGVNGYAVDADTNEIITKDNIPDAKPTNTKAPDTGFFNSAYMHLATSSGNLDGTSVSGANGSKGVMTWKFESTTDEIVSGEDGFKWFVVEPQTLKDGEVLRSIDDSAMPRRMNNFSIKTDDGKLALLENFRLEMEYLTHENPYHGSWSEQDDNPLTIYFHGSNPTVHTMMNSPAINRNDGTLVMLSHHGGYFVGNLEDEIAAGTEGYRYVQNGSGNHEGNSFYNDESLSTDIPKFVEQPIINGDTNVWWPDIMSWNPNDREDKPDLRGCQSQYRRIVMEVIGATMTMEIYDYSGELKETITETTGYEGAGYLNIGCIGAGAAFNSIKVTRLDAKGNAVDFNDKENGATWGFVPLEAVEQTRIYAGNNTSPIGWYRQLAYFRNNPAEDATYPLEMIGTHVVFDEAVNPTETAYIKSKFVKRGHYAALNDNPAYTAMELVDNVFMLGNGNRLQRNPSHTFVTGVTGSGANADEWLRPTLDGTVTGMVTGDFDFTTDVTFSAQTASDGQAYMGINTFMTFQIYGREYKLFKTGLDDTANGTYNTNTASQADFQFSGASSGIQGVHMVGRIRDTALTLEIYELYTDTLLATANITTRAKTNAPAFAVRLNGTDMALGTMSISMPVNVTFDKNDGTSATETVEVVKGGVIGNAMLTADRGVLYDFMNWNTMANGTGSAVTAATVIEEDMTLTAQWHQNLSLSIENGTPPTGGYLATVDDKYDNPATRTADDITWTVTVGNTSTQGTTIQNLSFATPILQTTPLDGDAPQNNTPVIAPADGFELTPNETKTFTVTLPKAAVGKYNLSVSLNHGDNPNVITATTATVTEVLQGSRLNVDTKVEVDYEVTATYSVEIDWDNPAFTFVFDGKATWDPDTLSYKKEELTAESDGQWYHLDNEGNREDKGALAGKEATATVKLTSYSNAGMGVNAQLTDSDADDGINFNWLNQGTVVSGTQTTGTLASAAEAGEQTSASFDLQVSGKPDYTKATVENNVTTSAVLTFTLTADGEPTPVS